VRVPGLHLDEQGNCDECHDENRLGGDAQVGALRGEGAAEGAEYQHHVVGVEAHLEDACFEDFAGATDGGFVGERAIEKGEGGAGDHGEHDEARRTVRTERRQEHIHHAGDDAGQRGENLTHQEI